MEQEKKCGKIKTLFKRIKTHMAGRVSSQEKLEARLLDYMQKHPELTPTPPAPPQGEFQKILEGLDKRGVKTVVGKQLKVMHLGRKFIFILHKPLIIFMVALVLMAASLIGGSAMEPYTSELAGVKYEENQVISPVISPIVLH